MREAINVTIRREREPLLSSGWKYMAYREVEVAHPKGKGYGTAIVLYPLHLSGATEEEVMRRVCETENVCGFHLTGTFDQG